MRATGWLWKANLFKQPKDSSLEKNNLSCFILTPLLGAILVAYGIYLALKVRDTDHTVIWQDSPSKGCTSLGGIQISSPGDGGFASGVRFTSHGQQTKEANRQLGQASNRASLCRGPDEYLEMNTNVANTVSVSTLHPQSWPIVVNVSIQGSQSWKVATSFTSVSSGLVKSITIEFALLTGTEVNHTWSFNIFGWNLTSSLTKPQVYQEVYQANQSGAFQSGVPEYDGGFKDTLALCILNGQPLWTAFSTGNRIGISWCGIVAVGSLKDIGPDPSVGATVVPIPVDTPGTFLRLKNIFLPSDATSHFCDDACLGLMIVCDQLWVVYEYGYVKQETTGMYSKQDYWLFEFALIAVADGAGSVLRVIDGSIIQTTRLPLTNKWLDTAMWKPPCPGSGCSGLELAGLLSEPGGYAWIAVNLGSQPAMLYRVNLKKKTSNSLSFSAQETTVTKGLFHSTSACFLYLVYDKLTSAKRLVKVTWDGSALRRVGSLLLDHPSFGGSPQDLSFGPSSNSVFVSFLADPKLAHVPVDFAGEISLTTSPTIWSGKLRVDGNLAQAQVQPPGQDTRLTLEEHVYIDVNNITTSQLQLASQEVPAVSCSTALTICLFWKLGTTAHYTKTEKTYSWLDFISQFGGFAGSVMTVLGLCNSIIQNIVNRSFPSLNATQDSPLDAWQEPQAPIGATEEAEVRSILVSSIKEEAMAHSTALVTPNEQMLDPRFGNVLLAESAPYDEILPGLAVVNENGNSMSRRIIAA